MWRASRRDLPTLRVREIRTRTKAPSAMRLPRANTECGTRGHNVERDRNLRSRAVQNAHPAIG
jgi:hypothetical protein